MATSVGKAHMKTLGDFRLVRPAGEGTLGYTYRGVASDGTSWAVKELHPNWGPPRVTWQRVQEVLWSFSRLREASDPALAVALHTLRAVSGYDGETDRAWVVTPWLDAGADGDGIPAVSLADALLSGTPLPAEAALYLMWQLLDLAQQLHAHGLTLSGLKPSNLFLTTGGAVVVDIHLALRLRELLHGPGAPTGGTRPPFLWAEAQWLPPELRRADAVPHPAGSLYTVGAITTFACTGTALFPTTDVIDALTHRKDNRGAFEDALAHWSAGQGREGARLRRTASKSVRHRSWARPGAKRLRRLIVPPLWGNRRRAVYCNAWCEYVRSALLHESAAVEDAGSRPGRTASPRPVEPPAPPPGASRPAGTGASRKRPPVVSAESTIPGAGQPGQRSPDGTPAPVLASATPSAPSVPEDAGPAIGDRTASSVSDTGGTRVLSPTRAGTPTGGSGTGQAWQWAWTLETDGPLLAPPLVMDSQLVVTCEGSAHVIDAATGSRNVDLVLRGTADSTPVIWNSRLWWALRDGVLSGYDLLNPDREARLELDGDPGPHSPVVANGRLLVGTTHGLFTFEPPDSAGESAGQRLICLDEPVVSPLATDGVRLWVPTEGRGLITVRLSTLESQGPHPPWDAAGCAPTLLADGAYIGDALGTVRQLTSEGISRRRWRVSGLPVTAPPVVHGDLLLVSDHAGTVVALSPGQDDEVWRAATDGDGRRAVTVIDDVVHVCGARSVRRLDARTGRELPPLTPDGSVPTSVSATPGHLHVGFADGRLSTWRRPG